jgi:hypothetical protein
MIVSFLYLEKEIKAAAMSDRTFSLLDEKDWVFLKELTLSFWKYSNMRLFI